MSHQINHVAVVGAGTMGAAIAALAANAGLSVLLLDMPPHELTPDEMAQGLTLDDPQVRNRLVQAGFARACQARPPAFVDEAAEQRVTLGNTEDDFGRLTKADWIIEAIIEKTAAKQALFARIEDVRRPDCIVTTNTSGLPISLLAQGRGAEFKRHFLGTHFFNPPRYLKLLEIIPTADTAPAMIETITSFGQSRLGKSTVLCKDTPNFIGNRLYSVNTCFAVQYALTQGYNVAQVDAVTGPLLGRPKTATFRLLDLIGIDVMAYIFQNLYDLIPHDPYRDVLRVDELVSLLDELLARDWLGNKRGQGFYKKEVDEAGQRQFKTLDFNNMSYAKPQPLHSKAVAAVDSIDRVGPRVATLLSKSWQHDRAAQYVWAVLCFEFAYAAACAQEIAYDLKSIDDNIRWGFGWQLGPFQLWDRLGVAKIAARMESDGRPVALWVKEMLVTGHATFYQMDDEQVTGFYDWNTKQYVDGSV